MKIIFLDIDGVLQPYNSKNRFENDREAIVKELSEKLHTDYSIYDEYDVAACYLDWDKEAVNRIKRIIKETGAKIVISSDWRSKRLVNKMKDFLKIWDMGEFWIGETDEFELDKSNMKEAYNYLETKYNSHYWDRTVEILDYVYNHKEITSYVAIDDMDLSNGLEGHFVATDNLINDEQTEECIRILNNNVENMKKC